MSPPPHDPDEAPARLISGSRSTTPLMEKCPQCEMEIDVSSQLPLSQILCPRCSAIFAARRYFDHYQIDSLLGRGGMGAVYKAFDIHLGRHVALKILREELSGDEKFISRLDAEAKITAAINHPNVVRVYNCGACHGMYYISFELIEGGSLAACIKSDGAMDESRTLEIGLQVASGLHAAYEKGLIHRDVKPGNILLVNKETVKVVDFGVAALESSLGAEHEEVWGSPHYIAPEKFAGPEDFRSDIYSLGATLYHAVTGHPPFADRESHDLLDKHLTNPSAGIEVLTSYVSEKMAFCIHRMLARDPNHRFQSYTELIEQLASARPALPKSLAEHPPAPPPASKVTTRRKYSRSILITAAVIALAMTAAFLAAKSHRAETEAKVSLEIRKQMEGLVKANLNEGFLLLGSGDYAAARERFGADVTPAYTGDDVIWSFIGSGLTGQADGASMEARNCYSGLALIAPHSESDPDVAAFARSVAQVLASRDPVPLETVQQIVVQTKLGPLALLLCGLKAWEAGEFDTGLLLVRRFKEEAPASLPGVVSLQRLADSCIEQYLFFSEQVKAIKRSTNPDETYKLLLRLRATDGLFSAAAMGQWLQQESFIGVQTTSRGLEDKGLYKIACRKTGEFLQGSPNPSSPALTLGNYDGAAEQEWISVPMAWGRYGLILRRQRAALCVTAGSFADHQPIELTPWTSNYAQHWYAHPLEAPWCKVLVEGCEKALTIDFTRPAKPAMQLPFAGGEEQQWRFLRIGEIDAGWIWRPLNGNLATGKARVDQRAAKIILSGVGEFGHVDDGQFICRDLPNLCSLSAKILPRYGPPDCRTGLMLRYDARQNSPYLFAGFNGDGEFFCETRNSETDAATNVPVTAAHFNWLKLSREGNTVFVSTSIEGIKWMTAAVVKFQEIPATVQVGCAVSSPKEHPCEAAFQDVKVHTSEAVLASPGKLPEPGLYRIRNVYSNSVLGIYEGSTLVERDKSRSDETVFWLLSRDGDKWKLVSKESGLALEENVDGKYNEVNLQTAGNQIRQLWTFKSLSENEFAIYSAGSGLCLDALGPEPRSNAAPASCTFTNERSQRWQFLPVAK